MFEVGQEGETWPAVGHEMQRRQWGFPSGECTGWVSRYSVSYADSNAEVLNMRCGKVWDTSRILQMQRQACHHVFCCDC